VISGEEEAAYAWAGVNFVTGSLLEASQGSGAANPLDAFGTLEVSCNSRKHYGVSERESRVDVLRLSSDHLRNATACQRCAALFFRAYLHVLP